MKITAILAAGLVAVTGIAPVALATPASAQRVVVHERTVVRHDGGRYGYRHRAHRRQVCRMEHRRHRNVRICRTVYR